MMDQCNISHMQRCTNIFQETIHNKLLWDNNSTVSEILIQNESCDFYTVEKSILESIELSILGWSHLEGIVTSVTQKYQTGKVFEAR